MPEQLLSPEQLEIFMQRATEVADKEREEELAEIHVMSPTDITERLEDALHATEIVIDGFRMSNGLSEGTAVAYASIMALRESIEDVLAWLEFKYPEVNPEDEESSAPKPKQKSHKDDDDAEM